MEFRPASNLPRLQSPITQAHIDGDLFPSLSLFPKPIPFPGPLTGHPQPHREPAGLIQNLLAGVVAVILQAQCLHVQGT